MAGKTSVCLDKWREYFRTANSSIFDIIENAIMVAASDCSYDFKLKRDRLAEVLFACKITQCFGCEKLQLAVPGGDCLEKSEDKCRSGIEAAGGSKDTKESKVNSSSRGNEDDEEEDDGYQREAMEMNDKQVRGHSYGDVEALSDEIEEESQFLVEVLRIKKILDNHEDEDDSLLFDSLRRLQLMPLSVETLKATEIGKSVNTLRKHGATNSQNLARSLIEDWKIMVDSWVESTKAIADVETRSESVKTWAVEEDGGLPSPPLDEGAFFTTPASMELSQFFNGMDDDGNPRNCGGLDKNYENGRTRPDIEKMDFQKPKMEAGLYRNPETVLKKPSQAQVHHKPSGPQRAPGLLKPSEPSPGRSKPATKPKASGEIKARQKIEPGSIQKKPMPSQKEKQNCSHETSSNMKLEASKRKLHERYQEAEKAKKQRTIQVVELHHLPNQNLVRRNLQARPGIHNRS